MYRILNAVLIILLAIIGQPVYASVDAGLAALEQGQQGEAIALFTASADDPRAQLALAKIYQNSDLDKADKWIKKALRTLSSDNKHNAEVYYTLGIIRGNQAQKAVLSALSLAKKSKRAFEKAIELEPQSVLYLQGLIRFHIQAPSIAGGSLRDATKLADKIKAIDPVQGILAHIDIASANDDLQKLKTIYADIVAKYSHLPELTYRAGLFYQQQKDYSKALSLFEKVSSSNSDDNEIFSYASTYQIGRTAVFSQSNIQRGIEALNDYIEHAPEHNDLVSKSWAKFRLALLLELSGSTEAAKTIYASLQQTEDENLQKQLKEKRF